MDLMGRIEDILSKARDIFNRNYEKGRDNTALKALSEQRSTIELLAKIAAYLHEAKAMELQSQQGDYESRRNAEEKEFINMALDRLNPAEADLWERLLRKIHGEIDDEIVPYKEEKWPEWRPPIDDDPEDPEPEPVEEPPQHPRHQPMRRTRLPKYSPRPIEPTRLEPYSPNPVGTGHWLPRSMRRD